MSVRALCAVLLVLAAGCGGTETVTTTVTVGATAKDGAPRDLVVFGYIDSLAREGAGYELRFDPAQFLSGETANVAAAEDGKVEPGEPVPNDNYVVDEGKRLFTFLVPADAEVTVLTKSPEGTPVSVAELAEIVAGEHAPLWEPIATGFWIRYRIDTVSSIEQQYRP
ncbi:MAG: hypothetical protein ACRDNB_12445 [Gaiellaceae bacterium]